MPTDQVREGTLKEGQAGSKDRTGFMKKAKQGEFSHAPLGTLERARELRMHQEHVAPEQWGKDHHSLIAYLETCSTDRRGKIDLTKLRINVRRAARLRYESSSVWRQIRGGSSAWNPEHGTVLKNGEVLPQHCDCACLFDLAREGLIEVHDWDQVLLLPAGRRMAERIREHKANGENYQSFDGRAALEEVRNVLQR